MCFSCRRIFVLQMTGVMYDSDRVAAFHKSMEEEDEETARPRKRRRVEE